MMSFLTSVPAYAQTTPRAAPPDALHQLNTAIETLTASVSASVVQVLVSGYRPVDETSHGEAGLVIGRTRSTGSGAVIDPAGYVITNAHVVAGAQEVQVVLHTPVGAAGPLQSLTSAIGRTVPARIVGVARDIDLALLKVEASGLPALKLASYDRIRQGELVFAFGNPEGLRNSVTMGVVSSTARQLDPDSPSVYVQTDAPINPGNSGGPLVNVDGELVGLNTFIITESGGSQGLGFAIPSAEIAAAYPQLRKYGHLHRGVVGMSVQAITPALAVGLGLSRTAGIIVSDVAPDGPAEHAGLQVRDIITAVDGKPIDNVPLLMLELGTRHAGDTLTLGLARGNQTLSLSVSVVENPHRIDQLTDLSDPDKNAVTLLGIVGVTLDDTIRQLLPALRIPDGVLVTARRQGTEVDSPLVAGDVIHAVNAFAVRSLDGLQVIMDGFKSSSQVVLQVERDQRLQFLTMTVR
jgi:serine protease Do